jgi:catechol 2,3-dioxygenase-like lactoylglutathione lyase family enzyme
MPRLRASHVGICVSDWKRSLRFYHDVLGFRYVDELEFRGEPIDTLLRLDGVELRAVLLEREGVRIELRHYRSPGHVGGGTPRPMNELGMSHLSMHVDDLDALLAELARAEVEILSATRVDEPEAGTRAIFIADPDGTLIELAQRAGP